MFLQIFLYFNFFVIGVLVVLGVQHAIAHFSGKHEVQKSKAIDVHIPQAVRDRLVQEAEAHFQLVLSRSAKDLQHELNTSIENMNKQLEGLIQNTLHEETKQYQAAKEHLSEASQSAMKRVESEVSGHEAELDEKLAAYQKELEQKLGTASDERKQHLIQQIDTKLSDAVISFLLDTLGHDVDLGSQTSYIVARLEENKDALKAEVKA